MANSVRSGKVDYQIESISCHRGPDFIDIEINYPEHGWEIMSLDLETARKLQTDLESRLGLFRTDPLTDMRKARQI